MARVPLITSKDQIPPEHHQIADAVIKSRGGIHGPFTVAMHSPAVASHLEALGGYVRFQGKLEWDSEKMRITNNSEADKFIKPSFRKGWSIS